MGAQCWNIGGRDHGEVESLSQVMRDTIDAADHAVHIGQGFVWLFPNMRW